MQLLNGIGFQRLESAVQAANLRQGFLVNNIANNDTPYFKRSSVAFESLLQNEMNGSTLTLEGRRTNERHFHIGLTSQIPTPSVLTDQSTVINNNLNNVDIDSEMTQLAENQLRYNAYIEQINYQIKMKRTAVEGR
ncbi:flagellar basal-body rod protein FlgB [Fontibacillus phaseoli]|uniref:Flagellar basal body rod protein FlgB n=1 Tax=Fontibacillus phaseoli TaxID=1416533 RepID=A0A369BJK9_9BACL|nr:flagellar basal body rod protein FlgB [Fontibacillus phaseoli]RCX21315.1 flagellar basal-body rod protein FlgB [Fontibacillus phaseoli]